MIRDEAHQALEARLVELKEQDRLSEEARAPVTLQQDSVGRLSRIDAMQVQAMALATQRRREAERSRISAALTRLDGSEWGYCTACGDEIAEGRLRNDPSAAKCVTCASDLR